MPQETESMRDRAHKWRRKLNSSHEPLADALVDIIDHVNHLEVRLEALEASKKEHK